MTKKLIIAIVASLLLLGDSLFLYAEYRQFTVASQFAETGEVKAIVDEAESLATLNITAKDFLFLKESKSTISDNTATFEQFFHLAQVNTRLFRLKIWDTNYRIIWSNTPDVIGASFPDNEETAEAYDSGRRVVESKLLVGTASDRNERLTESAFNNYIEAYFPIIDTSGKVVGIVECYLLAHDVVSKLQSVFYLSVALSVLITIIIFVVWYITEKRSKLSVVE